MPECASVEIGKISYFISSVLLTKNFIILSMSRFSLFEVFFHFSFQVLLPSTWESLGFCPKNVTIGGGGGGGGGVGGVGGKGLGLQPPSSPSLYAYAPMRKPGNTRSLRSFLFLAFKI